MKWAEATARRDENLLKIGIMCLILEILEYSPFAVPSMSKVYQKEEL